MRSKISKSLMLTISVIMVIAVLCVNVFAVSTIIVDNNSMSIYGIDNITEEDFVNSCCTGLNCKSIVVTNKSGKFGTGSVATIYRDTMASYTIVVFGDVSGDSKTTIADIPILTSEVIGVTSWSNVSSIDYDKYLVMASDLNRDGKITNIDVDIVRDIMRGYASVNQSNGIVTYTEVVKTEEDSADDTIVGTITDSLKLVFVALTRLLDMMYSWSN